MNNESGQKIAKFSMKATKGFKACILVFFEDSFIAMILDRKHVKEVSKEMKKYFKEQGISIFQRNQAGKDYWDDYSEKYSHMSVEELIFLSGDNFEVEYQNIIKKNITPFRKDVRTGDEIKDEMGQISLKCEDGRKHFNHHYPVTHPKYLQMLNLFNDKMAL